MGVINITPDSFSDGGQFTEVEAALKRAECMIDEGVDVIDLGAQSTRPGASQVSADDEVKRLMPVLLGVRSKFPKIITSIDTFYSVVAQKALVAGADWINDISGGRNDPNILDVVAQAKCPYILTHSRGNSTTMNQLSDYNDVTNDVIKELKISTQAALIKGVHHENIIWDPGLGFAKNTQHNLTILKDLELFKSCGYPLLIGASRKRFIGDVLDEPNTVKRIWGDIAVACRCSQANIELIRVHEVNPIKKALVMADQLW